MKFKWSNIPIPEAHIIGLILGYILQKTIGLIYFPNSQLIINLGWFLIIAGISFSAWAVVTAADTQISKSEKLLTGGPYAISRNPMYLGWFDIYTGFALILKAPWVLFLLPLVLIYNHFFDIRSEEQFLTDKFGEEYLAYQKKVRRYI